MLPSFIQNFVADNPAGIEKVAELLDLLAAIPFDLLYAFDVDTVSSCDKLYSACKKFKFQIGSL